jgi:hypothetical protein
MRRGRWLGRALALLAALASPAPAQAREVPAPRREPPLRIWYRSTDGCPDGAAFVGLLARLGRAGSLAGVGDRVDFVVTVAFGPGQSSGRLERQSSEGTVAIRDVAAARCSEVADALALSLDLALDPSAPASEAPAPEAPAPEAPALAPSGAWQTRLGAQGQLFSGVAGAVLPGAALFVDLRRMAPGLATRLSLWGARGTQGGAIELRFGLLGSRLEACWAWPLGPLAVSPCLGTELGFLVAEGTGAGGRSDSGVWSSGVAHARAAWPLSAAVALEAQAGIVLPFVRYRFDALTGGEVASSTALGAEAALGVSFIT